MREIIIYRSELLLIVTTSSFFILILIGFIIGLRYARNRRDDVTARQRKEIKILKKEVKVLKEDKEGLLRECMGYKAKLKSIAYLATANSLLKLDQNGEEENVNSIQG